jgi:hypothetical protein
MAAPTTHAGIRFNTTVDPSITKLTAVLQPRFLTFCDLADAFVERLVLG